MTPDSPASERALYETHSKLKPCSKWDIFLADDTPRTPEVPKTYAPRPWKKSKLQTVLEAAGWKWLTNT